MLQRRKIIDDKSNSRCVHVACENYFNVEQIMTQKIRKLCVRPYIITESLCHINTYWLFLLAERAKRKSDLTLKMKSHKKCELQSPPVKSNKLSYHGRHYNTSWNPMIWACDKNDIWHCQRHFQSTIRDLRKFALSQLFILWLSTNSHSNLFLCAICIWLSFATHLNYCLHYYF